MEKFTRTREDGTTYEAENERREDNLEKAAQRIASELIAGGKIAEEREKNDYTKIRIRNLDDRSNILSRVIHVTGETHDRIKECVSHPEEFSILKALREISVKEFLKAPGIPKPISYPIVKDILFVVYDFYRDKNALLFLRDRIQRKFSEPSQRILPEEMHHDIEAKFCGLISHFLTSLSEESHVTGKKYREIEIKLTTVQQVLGLEVENICHKDLPQQKAAIRGVVDFLMNPVHFSLVRNTASKLKQYIAPPLQQKAVEGFDSDLFAEYLAEHALRTLTEKDKTVILKYASRVERIRAETTGVGDNPRWYHYVKFGPLTISTLLSNGVGNLGKTSLGRAEKIAQILNIYYTYRLVALLHPKYVSEREYFEKYSYILDNIPL